MSPLRTISFLGRELRKRVGEGGEREERREGEILNSEGRAIEILRKLDLVVS